ncbi:MAG TPA: glutamate synthase-related protein, partial [Myxococcota bacterium]
LLALSTVQQRLVREGLRTHVGLIVEAGDVREVHHVACLLGFGAAAVNPWLAIDTIKGLVRAGTIDGDEKAAVARYIHAVDDGVLKVMSKLGISTLQSYRGAQLFEGIGIDADVVDRFFANTPVRLGGLSLAILHGDVRARHERAFATDAATSTKPLPVGGLYVFKRDGERHRWDPFTVKALQKAARAGDDATLWEAFRALADGDDRSLAPTALRDLLALSSSSSSTTAVPLDEVEDAASIVRRFGSGAMSLGALSPEAHETLAIAMNRIGGKSNSGEGGEEAHRNVVNDDGSDRRSFIRQVASGRFGVTLPFLVGARELQIKIAQGAKPGEGGQLPGEKVDARIGAVRHSTPGVTLISPPPHHDIYSIEDLKQLIWDLQSVNPAADISVKLVAQAGIGVVAAGVVKAGAGGITIAGYEGGTGASPLSSLKHAGVPWELGLAEARQVLHAVQLRQRVRLQVDGGLRTGRDVVIAALLGADEMGLATSALVAGGCVMMRKCHLNTCGVGVATQDPKLRAKYPGKADHIVNYFMWVAEDVRRHMAQLGVRRFDDLVGRVDLLSPRTDLDAARRLDVAPLLAMPSSSRAEHGPAAMRRVDVDSHRDHTWTAVVDDV